MSELPTRKIRYYGTFGPSCADASILEEMFQAGMTGLRLNTSHTRLEDASDWICMAEEAARKLGRSWELLIDLEGPELRMGVLKESLPMKEGESIDLPVPKILKEHAKPGQNLLLDDGKIRLEIVESRDGDCLRTRVLRGGILTSRKSIALEDHGINIEIPSPTLTAHDIENLRYAGAEDGLKRLGVEVTYIMQPFVRSAADLIEVRQALAAYGCSNTRIMAKIENTTGYHKLKELIPYSDEIIIARGDLGNAVGLEMLPVVQKQIEKSCREASIPHMVVTQMLNSMIQNPFPTRAEVSDIGNAVYCGASSLMLTNETAMGKYPIEAIRTLINTSENMLRI